MPCDYTNSVSRDHLGINTAKLRRRNGYDSSGQGTHDAAASVSFRQGFFNDADSWAAGFNTDMKLQRGTNWEVNWWGHIGVYGHCDSSGYSAHKTGQALDLTHIRFTNGSLVDMNWSWRQGLTHKRRYLAVAAHLRRNFNVVLTAYYPNHADHIHFDNDTAQGPLSDSSVKDTLIVQMACNWINSAGLALDGAWGQATENAFIDLRNKMGLSCLDIRGNLADTKTFLYFVFVDAIQDRAVTRRDWVC